MIPIHFSKINNLYDSFEVIKEFMQEAYMNPPTLMDIDWKLVIFINSVLSGFDS